MRHDARAIIEAGIAAVEPGRCVREHIAFDGAEVRIAGEVLRPRRVIVVGGGKAAVAMAEALPVGEGALPRCEGVLHGPVDAVVGGVRVVRSGHPLPTVVADEVLALAQGAGPEDLLLVLLSGGASAMLSLPLVPLVELRRVTEGLLRQAVPIEDLNCVRKHLDRIKGGRLAAATRAQVRTLVLSDVPGDPLDAIGSGPTAPDPTTVAMAEAILPGLPYEETPKPGDPAFDRVRHVIIGNNERARAGMAEEARARGYRVVDHAGFVRGEAALAGLALLEEARRHPGRVALVAGGETTVDLGDAHGRGGRNQELVLACVGRLPPGELVASAGTDGLDGASHAAGAMADASTPGDPLPFLREHDSTAFFEEHGGLIVTGPSGTNVADVAVVLRQG